MGYEFSPFDLFHALSSAIEQVAHQRGPDVRSTSAELLPARELERRAPKLAALAMRELRARKSRAMFLAPTFFGEPAWNMLLDLFVQQFLGQRVSVTSATIASDAPQATALRYVALMEDEGLIERHRSSTDRRVSYLRLTQQGYLRVGTWLSNSAGALAAMT
jgi:hypothetical protein